MNYSKSFAQNSYVVLILHEKGVKMFNRKSKAKNCKCETKNVSNTNNKTSVSSNAKDCSAKVQNTKNCSNKSASNCAAKATKGCSSKGKSKTSSAKK